MFKLTAFTEFPRKSTASFILCSDTSIEATAIKYKSLF